MRFLTVLPFLLGCAIYTSPTQQVERLDCLLKIKVIDYGTEYAYVFIFAECR